MHIYTRQVALIASGLFLAGCVAVPALGQANTCSPERECTVTGEMTVYRGVPGSVAAVTLPDGCIAVALSNADYVRYQKRRALRVRVTGIAYKHGAAEGAISYRLRDRDVATGICSSALVIYASKVESIRRK